MQTRKCDQNTQDKAEVAVGLNARQDDNAADRESLLDVVRARNYNNGRREKNRKRIEKPGESGFK